MHVSVITILKHHVCTAMCDKYSLYTKLTVNGVSSSILTALSLSSSIVWDDCEGILVTGTGVVRTENVVCLCEVMTVSTGDGCWVLLICHIVDEDRVPDIRILISHIQSEWCFPRHIDV